jgi:hypothetical protein
MSNIFISYKREEREWVSKLVIALEKNDLTVWWDPKINVGQAYFNIINKVIVEVDCILVIWSKDSIISRWVISEASVGMERKNIIPVLVDEVTPPIPFNIIQSANLIDWDGDENNEDFQKLLSSIKTYCPTKLEKDNVFDEPLEITTFLDNPTTPLSNETLDSKLWKEATHLNTKMAFKNYLDEYPNGKHHKKAEKRIRGLAFKKQLILSALIIGILIVVILLAEVG